MVVHRRGAMFDIAKIAARQPLPRGSQVGLVTNSFTLCQQMVHTITAVGMLTDAEPVLLPSEAGPEEFVAAARAALADPTCDSVLCAAVNVYEEGTEDVIEALDAIAGETDKPLVGVFLDFHLPMMREDEVDVEGELPRFDAPADAIQALAALTAYAHWRERDPGAVPLLDPDILRAKRVVHRVLSAHPQGRELTDEESAEVLAAYGIPLVRRYPVASLEEATAVADHLGWNVALKATAATVRGRPDQANVHRNLGDTDDLAQAWSELDSLVRELGLGDDVGSVGEPVVQVMAPPGVALVVTSREDAAFGPLISMGLEGIPTELLGDTVYRVPPLTTTDAAAMVRDLKAAPTLFGRHGSPGVHVAGIEDLLHRVAQLADDLPQLASVQLSPCVASLNGMSVLGARIFTAPTDDRRDPMARTL
jgi:acyl-CoA synthetase (NDP forming)